jgi:glycerol uptake facilitator protein
VLTKSFFMESPTPSLRARCLAEVLGTFILVFFGCGAVHAAVLTDAQKGLWQVAIVWGVAIMVAIYVIGGISGSHINPAITIALAVCGRVSRTLVLPYIASQLIGAFIAALALFVLYSPQLEAKERAKGVQRGQPGSEITAMCYGEYFPNPVAEFGNSEPATAKLYKESDDWALSLRVPVGAAFLAELLGTLLLALVVFALTDERNTGAPPAYLAPVFIGLVVAILISVIAPLTQACFNPARDFGPRLFACLAGWGRVALPGLRSTGFFTVYILAPVVGAVAGGGLYLYAVRPGLPGPEAERIIRS